MNYKNMTADEIYASIPSFIKPVYDEVRRRLADDNEYNTFVEIVSQEAEASGVDFFELQPIASAMSAAVKRANAPVPVAGGKDTRIDRKGNWDTTPVHVVEPREMREKLGLNASEFWVFWKARQSGIADFNGKMRYAYERYNEVKQWFINKDEPVDWKRVGKLVGENV